MAADRATWRTTGEYLTHINELPMGANLAPLVPHSMLRIEVMGLAASITRDPTERELATMVELLDRARGKVTSASPPTACRCTSSPTSPT